MRRLIFLLPVLGLAACATPREQCVASVTRDLTVVNALIQDTTLTLQRGYGLETRQDVRQMAHMCSDTHSDGSVDWDICYSTYVRDVDVPIAVDLRQEQVKLRQLEQQRDRLQEPTAAAVAQCAATYPE